MGKINWHDLRAIYRTVASRPGITKCDLARAVGIGKNSIESRLATLERHEFYLYEDDYGALYIAQLDNNRRLW